MPEPSATKSPAAGAPARRTPVARAPAAPTRAPTAARAPARAGPGPTAAPAPAATPRYASGGYAAPAPEPQGLDFGAGAPRQAAPRQWGEPAPPPGWLAVGPGGAEQSSWGGTPPAPAGPAFSIPDWLKQTFRIYLYALMAALVVMGALFIVNVFYPLGRENISRSGFTLIVLLLAWGWGVLGAWMMQYKPLLPAGALGMLTGIVAIVVIPMDIWGLGRTYDFSDIAMALFVLQFFAAGAVAAVRSFLRNENVSLTFLTLGMVAVGAMVAALAIVLPETSFAQREFSDKLSGMGWGIAVPMCIGSTLLLLPIRPRLVVARNVAYAGFVELAIFLAIKPWIEDSLMVDRLDMAAFAIAIILGLVALSFFLIDVLNLRREGTGADKA